MSDRELKRQVPASHIRLASVALRAVRGRSHAVTSDDSRENARTVRLLLDWTAWPVRHPAKNEAKADRMGTRPKGGDLRACRLLDRCRAGRPEPCRAEAKERKYEQDGHCAARQRAG